MNHIFNIFQHSSLKHAITIICFCLFEIMTSKTTSSTSDSVLYCAPLRTSNSVMSQALVIKKSGCVRAVLSHVLVSTCRMIRCVCEVLLMALFGFMSMVVNILLAQRYWRISDSLVCHPLKIQLVWCVDPNLFSMYPLVYGN